GGERGAPVSPSGGLDACEGKVPRAGVPGRVIEPRPGERARELAPPDPARPAPETAKPVETPPPQPAPSRAEPAAAAPQEGSKIPPSSPQSETAAKSASAPVAGSQPISTAANVQAAPVIPLMHAPDHPGLARKENHDADAEPPQPPKQEGWWRTLFG